MQITSYSYRFASEVLDSEGFSDKKHDIIEVLAGIDAIPQLNQPKTRERNGKKMTFTTDQLALNKLLDHEFGQRGWDCQPLVTNDGVTKIKADYKKDKVQVEVQFGNMARWYTDVFKFQVSYSLGLIDVGVLVVPIQAFAATIDENVAYYERVIRELPYAKMSITLPIWVLGIQP
ncbi:MAG TPA: BglII/BstYI family type II restriction endonuclease [Patescibacteria group bacterium]|nr:BglII/BstYI family type II restriction endonuclease [Patescibacteria group bacterium]